MEKRTIYFAGGCFWGLEKLFSSIPGVVSAVSGYANGIGEECADYRSVCTGQTGFRETVRVEYDPDQVSLETLLFDYFYVIDPTVSNRQGNDIGSQYQTGIYYTDDQMRKSVEEVAKIERERISPFKVEIGPLINFFPAEEYHQKYLDKNPEGYSQIPVKEIEILSQVKIDPGCYRRPSEEEIRSWLTREQYEVTQRSGTEQPFHNQYWDQDEKGIYVDIVTGEPLFVSADKYQSSCGWPAFSKPIEEPVLIERRDRSHGMVRTEVRSRTGDSHLGHVFDGDPESPTGIRYCINSAALRFIPYSEMDREGYGYLKDFVRPVRRHGKK